MYSFDKKNNLTDDTARTITAVTKTSFRKPNLQECTTKKDRCIGVFYSPSICLERKHIIIHFFFMKFYFPVFAVHLVNNMFHGSRKLSLMRSWGFGTIDFSIGYFQTVRTFFFFLCRSVI